MLLYLVYAEIDIDKPNTLIFMVHASPIKISSRGNVLLPKEFRDALGSDVVMAEMGKNHEIVLMPFKTEVESESSQGREVAWKSLQARMTKGYDFKHEKFNRDELYDRYEGSIHHKNSASMKNTAKKYILHSKISVFEEISR